MKILAGHLSPESAYVVDDYPYGFRLRCRIRYWLEYHPKRGFRFWSQTTNPKRGHVWNAPKASTFCRYGGAMYLNDEGHVTWSGVHEYMDTAASVAWRDQFGYTMPYDAQTALNRWIAAKQHYDQARAEGRVSLTVSVSTPAAWSSTTNLSS